MPQADQPQAQWDLGTLGERKSTGGEQFFSISEQKMLHFTLPLLEEEGQNIALRTDLKTIQLFLLNVQDFYTAVNYLSQNAGLRHCHLKNVSANIVNADAPRHAQSQPREPSGASTMGPPMGPPMRPRVRPLSQASVFAPARSSPAQFVRRPQTARPSTMLVDADPTQYPQRPGTAVPVRGRIPPQGHRYRPSLPWDSQDPRSFFSPDGSSQLQRFPSRAPSAVGGGDRIPLYEHPMRRVSMATHGHSSRAMQYNEWEPSPPHQQVETDPHHVLAGLYHDRFDDQFANEANQASSSARRTISMRASLFEKHPSSQPDPERATSRSPPVSESGAPIKIQVLGPPDEPSHPYSRPNIRWEFLLHLLPSTKMYEVCLHAASYIRREYRSTVDGRALAAQNRDGTVFGDQDTLSEEILKGEALLLVDHGLLGTARPVPNNLSGSQPDPLHPDWTLEAGRLHRLHPASSKNLTSQTIDELDKVPPPRQLPFRRVAAPGPPRSSSSTLAAQSPLSERPDLINASIRPHTSEQIGPPISEDISTKTATRKHSGSRQRRPQSASRRPASSVSGRKPDAVSAITKTSEPQTLTRRPETSLGIQRNRQASSHDAGVTAATPPVMESIPSGAEVSKPELATAACMTCKNKKRKCNRVKPACGACLKDNRKCIYANIPKPAAKGSVTDKSYKGHGLETITAPMVLRSPVTSLPAMSDALTQTSHSWESRDIDTQTQSIEHGEKDVEIKDMGTDPCNLYTDASMETDRCNDTWLPFSQCAELMIWAGKRSEEQLQKAADVFKTTDPSHEDYRSKVEQAAVYAVGFENELRDKCVEVLRR